MPSLSEAIRDFLDQRRIAVAGVSRNPGQAANGIFKKLQDSGYEVYAVNPKTNEVEGSPCYPDLRSIPVKPDGVVVVTPPEAVADLVRECIDLDISRIWMHRSFGAGSVSDEAVALCEQNEISVIAGACPMMYCEPVDFGHKCIRWLLKVSGGLPREVQH
jgi:predicted CoA-binding protein